jgi:hypothetical protein
MQRRIKPLLHAETGKHYGKKIAADTQLCCSKHHRATGKKGKQNMEEEEEKFDVRATNLTPRHVQTSTLLTGHGRKVIQNGRFNTRDTRTFPNILDGEHRTLSKLMPGEAAAQGCVSETPTWKSDKKKEKIRSIKHIFV